MAIIFKLDAQGGFTCGDTETGLTSYAYPTSEHAMKAKKAPVGVAQKMLRAENSLHSLWLHTACNQYDRLNWRKLD